MIKTLKDKADIDYYKNELLWTSVKLKRSEAEMKLFCKATNRKIDTTRSQVHAFKDDTGRIVAFNKSISQKARHTAIKHHNDWLKSIGAENSTLNTLEKYYKGKYNKSEEYIKLATRSKEFGLLKNKNQHYTQEQLKKCITLYNETEKNGFIASSHFMEQFIKREFKKDNSVNYQISDIINILTSQPIYSDIGTGRLVKGINDVYILTDKNRIVTLIKTKRISDKWKKT